MKSREHVYKNHSPERDMPGNDKSGTRFRFILVTGPKHSGKSFTSQALEKITGWKAVDLDTLVEKQTGKSPRALYKEGADIFRKAEAQALASLTEIPAAGETGLIIAAGGGFVDNPEAMELLSQHREITTVYLDISAETAWKRILQTAQDGELPPFLNTENPWETQLALHTRRAKAYKAMAHVTISAENKNPEEIAEEIADRLELHR